MKFKQLLKKDLVKLILFLFFCNKSLAQVGIGTTSPSNKSSLEIKSTSSGLLIPRMTTNQRNAIVPNSTDEGLVVYDTDVENFFFYNPISGLWTGINTGGIKTITATTYTLSSNDYGKVLDFTSNTNITLTVPNTLPKGFQVSITQAGTGVISINGSGGMVISNRWGSTQSSGQWAKIGIEVRGTNSAVLSGDLK